jgi:hypothetical protein
VRAPKIAVFLVAAAACTSPTPRDLAPEHRESTPRFYALTNGGKLTSYQDPRPLRLARPGSIDWLKPSPERRAELARRRLSAWSTESNVRRLTRPITGARFGGGGERLVAVIASLPEERRVLGPSGLTVEQLHGAGGLCEPPSAHFELTRDGEMFEASYATEPGLWYTAPAPALYALSSTCTAALAAAGSNTAAAIGGGCTREDEAAHFQPGSACRACIEARAGDYEACISVKGDCQRMHTREVGITTSEGTEYFDVFEGLRAECAPNFVGEYFVLARELSAEDDPLRPYQHDVVFDRCEWFWNTGLGDVEPLCFGAEQGEISTAFGDVVSGRIEYIRRAGDPLEGYGGRMYLASRLEVDGYTFDALPLSPGTIAELSEHDEPLGWKLNPQRLRADGTDPDNIDHTLAREWISALGMKTATTLPGVPIFVSNKNLCPEDSWEGPDSRGRYHCLQPYGEPADERDWQYDYRTARAYNDPTSYELFPFVTLAATGLMDPGVPGGHAIHILGTPTLGDPEWESCTWPDVFLPDEMSTSDAFDQPDVRTYTAQTHKFGKDPRLNIRMTLSTNWRRGFCTETLPGL